MKQLDKIVLGFLLMTTTLILSSHTGFAQNNSRMQQDLRISQGILSELLKSNSGNSQFAFRGHESNVKSSYIPGYGVIFELSNNSFVIEASEIETINVRGTENGEDEVHVTVNSSNAADKAKEQSNSTEAQKAKVMEYFMNYADLLGQLKSDEKITVIVRRGSAFQFFGPPSPPSPPTTSVRVAGASSWTSSSNNSSGFIMSAKRSDISGYKSGSISESQFKDRVSTTDIQRESPTELRIFERILETGLSSDANPTFSLRSGLTSVNDANSGLLILGTIRGGSSNAVFFREVELDSLKEVTEVRVRGLDSLMAPRVSIRGNVVTLDRNLDTLTVDLRRANEQLERSRAELARVREFQVYNTGGGVEFFPSRDSANQRTEEEMQQDLEAFIESTKDLLLDYGRTLESVKSGQSIMLHFNLRTSGDTLPNKLIFSVNKNVIENYDKRSISKEAAKAQISVVKHRD